ncbi:MAG: long-chain fatty acid--CoA ligase, partial [Elusimicrobiota bacterium]
MKSLRCKTPLGPVLPSVGMMMSDRRRRFGALPVYREKRRGGYETLSWEGLYARVSRVGAALIERGLKKGEVAAIYSRNREEMLVFELAAMSIGAIAAPIFSEYPAYHLDYVLSHARPKFLAVSDEPHLKVVLRTKASKKIKRIFVMDAFRRRPGRKLASFDELYGDSPSIFEFRKRVRGARPKDACLLMYTSGTTGRPKGVLLCHENILSQRKAMELLWDLKPGGRVLSYLPWHHSFGGIYELFGALYSGACLTLDESYGKDLNLLIRNFKRVKPTIYFSVPRIHQALVEEARSSKKAEKEIFHKELQFVFTAAAALPKHVSDFYAKKGIPVVEGWGLTETSPCVTVTRFGHKRRPGAVGVPIPGVAVKVAADGEILVKGPNVMLGYYRDRKLTRECIRRGWFHTGDFGA